MSSNQIYFSTTFNMISRIASLYPSLKYLNSEDYRVDKPHVAPMTVAHVAPMTVAPSVMDVRRLRIKLRLMTVVPVFFVSRT